MNVGVKYAEKQERKFEPEKLREGRNIIGLQVMPLPHLGLNAEQVGVRVGGAEEAWRVPWSPQALGGQDVWLLLNYMLGIFCILTHSSSGLGHGYCYHRTLYIDGETEAWRR